MDYKTANRTVYDTYAKQFEERTKTIDSYIREDAELFAKMLGGPEILDLGSGPGRDSVFFKDNELNPVCLDISVSMAKLCRQKNLQTIVGDLENIPLPKNTFNGVWAHTSLLHMPKNKLPDVLEKIRDILKPNGVFYCGMKEGNFEGWTESDKYPSCQRFFALYTDEELRKLLSVGFHVINQTTVSLGDAVFLKYLCRRQN